MAQKKNIKAVEADAVLGKTVYVLVCDWSDRHGDSDVNEPMVFATLKSARLALATDVEAYIDMFGGWKEDDTLDTETIYSVDENGSLTTRTEIIRYAKKQYRMHINQDDNGTYANWSIHRVKVK